MAKNSIFDGAKKGFDLLKNKKKGKDKVVNKVNADVLGSKLPFEAAESYKLLRANLGFSLPENDGCRVIAVTSAMRGEGKSTVSINLAYTIAQTGKRVLLVDCDMRLPSIAKKLNIQQRPGLSNTLVGISSLEEAVRHSDEISSWDILPSGSIPPNPSELLGTRNMENLMNSLREKYDTIIVDLPPVTIVSDAMVISNIVDGFIVVVKQDYADKTAVLECMKQMEVIKPKILGFVVTASTKNEKGYYYRYGHRYGRYYKSYSHHYYGHHYGYGHGYGHSHGYGYDKKSYGYGNASGYDQSYGYSRKTSRNPDFIEVNENTIYQREEKDKD